MNKRNEFLYVLAMTIVGLTFFLKPSLATPIEVDSIRSNLTGGGMTSMDVTVTYKFGSTTSTIQYDWLENIASDPTLSGVEESWGSLTVGSNLDTYYPGRWVLSQNSDYSITSVVLTGNDVLFDLYYSENKTPGSKNGFFGNWSGNDINTDLSAISGFSPWFHWEFSDEVALKGQAAQDDVFNTLTLTMIQESDNFDFNGERSWYQGAAAWDLDTDLAVPEPSAFLLFGFGLLGAAAVGRKRI